MNKNEITEKLNDLKDWKLIGNTIVKEFEFANFSRALEFVNKVGKIANDKNHHPDILLYSYKKVKITSTTHSENAITYKDFDLAKKIDKL